MNEWRRDDPRWRVRRLDTSATPPALVGETLAWIEEERELLQTGSHPLAKVLGDQVDHKTTLRREQRSVRVVASHSPGLLAGWTARRSLA
jgi:hypothetical protein